VAEERPAATRVATRADALANRERILAVSYAAFAADPMVSLNAIAKLAGVGPGTLYRHFPAREDLLLAVYQQEIQVLAVAVDGVLEQYPPIEALRVWFGRLADLVRVKHGLGEALQTAAAQHVVSQTDAPVTRAIGVLR
jgi:AcrR family transcriptional regulator